MVHVVRNGLTDPLYLSGDLDVDLVSPPAPSEPVQGAVAAPERSDEIRGGNYVPLYAAVLGLAAASLAAAIWTYRTGDVGASREVAGLWLFWAVFSGVGVGAGLLGLWWAVPERRRRYRVERSAEGDSLVVSNHGQVFPLGALTGIEEELSTNERFVWWRLHFGERQLSIKGDSGRQVVDLVRRARPEMSVHRYHPPIDASGGN